jgi:hypothetical protein
MLCAFQDFDFDNIPTELMLFQLGDLLLVGEPGEVFSEPAVNLRVALRNLGYKELMLVIHKTLKSRT